MFELDPLNDDVFNVFDSVSVCVWKVARAVRQHNAEAAWESGSWSDALAPVGVWLVAPHLSNTLATIKPAAPPAAAASSTRPGGSSTTSPTAAGDGSEDKGSLQLKVKPSVTSRRTGYSLTPGVRFVSSAEVVDSKGNLWVKVGKGAGQQFEAIVSDCDNTAVAASVAGSGGATPEADARGESPVRAADEVGKKNSLNLD